MPREPTAYGATNFSRHASEQRINEQQHPVPDALDADEVLEADAI
jgi:hypothetical protein